MNLQSAKNIGRKARAYEHCVKLLQQIDKQGSATMKIGNTGIEFIVQKGDGIYLRLKTTLSSLTEELSLISKLKTCGSTPLVAPIGAAPDEEVKREKKKEYYRSYYAAHRDHILAQRRKRQQ